MQLEVLFYGYMSLEYRESNPTICGYVHGKCGDVVSHVGKYLLATVMCLFLLMCFLTS